MGLSRQIFVELPMLRRFARAACGTQEVGDAYVETCLTQLLASPELVQNKNSLRIVLYQALVDAMHAIEPLGRAPDKASPAKMAASAHLMKMTPRHRIAFLLKSLEGFSDTELALILTCSEEEAERLVERGSAEIAAHLQTDVLIIEDEPLIALDLEDLVNELGHRVIGVARTHAEAIKLIAHRKPGIVLSDIKLADGSSGLSAVNEILECENVPVIFITAYPERSLKGNKPEPAYLVTKPYLPETVRALISQALFFDRRAGKEQVSAA